MLLVSLGENWGNVIQEAMARLFEDLCGQARARETRV